VNVFVIVYYVKPIIFKTGMIQMQSILVWVVKCGWIITMIEIRTLGIPSNVGPRKGFNVGDNKPWCHGWHLQGVTVSRCHYVD